MKIGVVGYGSIGQRHANNLRGMGHDVRVYDPVLSKSGDFRFERQLYDSDVEAVVIATPTLSHEGPLRAGIERGKHVLIEKPISTGIGTLPALLQAADDKGLVVMMGNNLRFHPAIEQAQAWLMQGLPGKPIWANFICAQENDKYRDSVVLNWGAHEVDVAMHLFGPASVQCASVTEDERIADFVLLHEGGVRSSFHLDYVTPVEIREAWIACEDHNIGIDLLGRRISLGKWAQAAGGTYDDDYLAEVKTFVERIDGRIAAPGASGHDGLAVLRVLLNVRKRAGLL